MNERQFRWSVEIFALERPSVGATLEAVQLPHRSVVAVRQDIGRRLDDV